ncbi:putative major outer membrane protein P44-20 [Anaplasma phagocytophilum str. ApNP]|uniref:Putative major outer membrane protein P44-20 n=1 Tax=Anaplasma phagocytophilum str. ApNP TaxID=1359153 RepID=A0A0F3NF61_ANAPH|nr:putative major outer membrane protein P44-20 [Anaplasma phagocytophilum str. ApNP]
MKISSPEIDGKVCSGDHAKEGASNTPTKFGIEPDNGTNTTAQCSGLNKKGAGKFSGFVTGVGLVNEKNWPRGRYYGTTGGAGIKDGAPNSNAEAVAKDLIQELTPEEKTIVAGLLAKTIEGGEVVEIRAVSSTSVMA